MHDKCLHEKSVSTSPLTPLESAFLPPITLIDYMKPWKNLPSCYEPFPSYMHFKNIRVALITVLTVYTQYQSFTKGSSIMPKTKGISLLLMLTTQEMDLQIYPSISVSVRNNHFSILTLLCRFPAKWRMLKCFHSWNSLKIKASGLL